MKKLLMFFAVLGFALPGMAQHPDCNVPEQVEWTFAEIIAYNYPVCKSIPVVISFGQTATKLKDYYLKDTTGKAMQFNSAIDALNHMTTQGWEFVQAYTSGEDSCFTHYLLRMRAETSGNEK